MKVEVGILLFSTQQVEFLKNEVKNKFYSQESRALEKLLGSHSVKDRRNFELFEVKRSVSEFLKFQIQTEEG
jgi:hypothetical protein